MYRPTYLEVDGKVLEDNVRNIVSSYPNYKYYFAVVKNNAYHHGIYAIKYMIAGGANYLCVSSLEEALDVRKYNSDIPVLILEPINPDYYFDAIANNITVTIGSLDEAKKIGENKYKDDLKIHLKVDSGMHRLGFTNSKDFKAAYDYLKEMKHVIVEGVYTHLATSGIQDSAYYAQLETFKDITSLVNLNDIPIVHVDRSLTFTHHDKIEFTNGIRMGIAMYGYSQNIPKGSFLTRLKRRINQKKNNISNIPLTTKLNQNFALSLYSSVLEVRKVCKGDFSGYGKEYVFKNDSYVATIPVGYADGITKKIANVFIGNRSYKIIAECMDMIMVEVGKNVKPGDIVEIVGKNQNLRTIGARLGYSGYKTLNVFTNRIPLVYKYDDEYIEIKY